MENNRVEPKVNAFRYAQADSVWERAALANAHGYRWAYQDATENATGRGVHVPDGWEGAYLEHRRRNPGSGMAIREAFTHWRLQGTLPGLS